MSKPDERPTTHYVLIKAYRNRLGFSSLAEALSFVYSAETDPRGESDELFEYTVVTAEQGDHKGMKCLGPATGPHLTAVKGDA